MELINLICVKNMTKKRAKIATADGMTDYTIEVCAGSQRGDNFIAIINRVTLRGHRNGTPAELRLVIKLSSSCAVKRKVLQMDALFKREVLMYTKILPMLETFQCDRGLTGAKGFTSFPKLSQRFKGHHISKYYSSLVYQSVRASD